MAYLSNFSSQRILSHFQGDWASRLNVDQMFILVDGVLPFEACLYYQVLPLFLEGNRLHLGMVSPEDTSASEYVRRIIFYLNYSLVSHSISSEALRAVLTAYLNHLGNQQAISGIRHEPVESVSYGHHRHSARTRVEQQVDPNERLTLVVDSPDDLYTSETQSGEVSVIPTPPPVVEAPPVVPPPPHALKTPTEAQIPESNPNSEPQTELGRLPDVSSHHPNHNSSNRPLEILRLEANYLTSPVEVLATLPPQELIQELLARVLLGGIGRLYFECHPQHGRVVWSQNGILQSVLDQLMLPIFQGVLQELKGMAAVSLMPVEQAQQTEIEYLYDRNRVLLRFRFMVGTYGEEATVQVLRGAALKFYQQQQLNKLEKDAVSIAQQLQNKLNEIRARAYSDPALIEPKFEGLSQLSGLLHNIEQQLDDLGVEGVEQTE